MRLDAENGGAGVPGTGGLADIINGTLISPCFCGGRSRDIYSESHLPAANNVHLGVFPA